MEQIECVYSLGEIPNDDDTPKEITPVVVAYVIGVGWQLTTTNDGAIYTPQSYEATFGVLPKLELPKNINTLGNRNENGTHIDGKRNLLRVLLINVDMCIFVVQTS